MSFTSGQSVLRALSFGALTIVLSAGPAHAQGRCMQRQLGGQRSLQSLPHAVPQQNSLQTYALQAYAVPQQNLLQAYALQQYALQQYALQQYGFQAQLGASQSAALLPRQGTTQPTGLASADALRSRLDDLQDYIADQEKNGQLTPSQRRALRQQEKALTKQLRIAEKRAANSQKRQAYLSPLDSAE